MGLKNARSVPALWQYRAMHPVGVRQEIIDRVIARRGRLHWFDRLEPAKTALVAIDMQSTFCAPGGPAEVPSARARNLGVDTLLIAGTKTNVCCESTARGERGPGAATPQPGTGMLLTVTTWRSTVTGSGFSP
jgi:hypothetical protein